LLGRSCNQLHHPSLPFHLCHVVFSNHAMLIASASVCTSDRTGGARVQAPEPERPRPSTSL
ncbi:hypothetical protein ACJX0J_035944, partial [Zea mays]